MSTTFTWNISNLEREVIDGYVYVCHYTVDAKDTPIPLVLTARLVWRDPKTK